jgi:small conductance mechanosensitive channel
MDNNTAIIPNGPIINDNIINFSTKDSIRVDVHVGIAYHENIDTAKEVLVKVIEANSMVLPGHEGNGVFVDALADSSVNLIVRGYTLPEDYWSTYFAITEASKKALDKAKIQIPFPQRVVHMQHT